MRRLALLIALAAAPALTPALAEPFAPELPQGAYVAATEASPATSFSLPTGPFNATGGTRVALDGARSDTAWRLRANQQTTLQILAPLRAQIEAAGYRVLYECETESCGGFDFRYALDLLPEPEMHVDLADFRYLAARKGRDWLALTVSRSSESGFVHLTTLNAQQIAAADTSTPLDTGAPAPAAPLGPFAERLEDRGGDARCGRLPEPFGAGRLSGDPARGADRAGGAHRYRRRARRQYRPVETPGRGGARPADRAIRGHARPDQRRGRGLACAARQQPDARGPREKQKGRSRAGLDPQLTARDGKPRRGEVDHQASGPLSAKVCARKSMKARTLGWVNRPGG